MLQIALRRALTARDTTEERLVDSQKLTISRSTLHRFRNMELPNPFDQSGSGSSRSAASSRKMMPIDDARKLWDELYRTGVVEPIFHESGSPIVKEAMHSQRSVANSMMSFFGAGEHRISEFVERGGTGTYLAYKMSTKRPGYIIKSKFSIEHFQEEYLIIRDHQVSSGYREPNRARFEENSDGFGFFKSRRLWAFMREDTEEQPRVFCFYYFSQPAVESGRLSKQISLIYGRTVESYQRFGTGSFHSYILLVHPDTDKQLMQEIYPEYEYDMEEQLDIYEIGTEGKDVRGRMYNFAKFDYIRNFLGTGEILP